MICIVARVTQEPRAVVVSVGIISIIVRATPVAVVVDVLGPIAHLAHFRSVESCELCVCRRVHAVFRAKIRIDSRLRGGGFGGRPRSELQLRASFASRRRWLGGAPA
jgi:hypothetical protein